MGGNQGLGGQKGLDGVVNRLGKPKRFDRAAYNYDSGRIPQCSTGYRRTDCPMLKVFFSSHEPLENSQSVTSEGFPKEVYVSKMKKRQTEVLNLGEKFEFQKHP